MSVGDLKEVIEIWLETNLETHDFIESSYWENNTQAVSESLLQAEVYVYESNNKILGFVGLDGEYIAGIFISSSSQSRGVGKKIMDYVKTKREKLYLNVYVKNKRAIHFYKRESFKVIKEELDKNTSEKEWVMSWKKR